MQKFYVLVMHQVLSADSGGLATPILLNGSGVVINRAYN
jgi:hypothetical protein